MSGSSACGDNRERRPFRRKADGNRTGRHVGNHHRYHERRNALRSLAQLIAVFRGGENAADSAADVHAEALRLDGSLRSAVAHRLFRRSHGVLDEQIVFPQITFFKVLQRIKILHLSGNLHFFIGNVKAGNKIHTADALCQRIPIFFKMVADRGDGAHSRYDYSSHFVLPFSARLGLHGKAAVNPNHFSRDVGRSRSG